MTRHIALAPIFYCLLVFVPGTVAAQFKAATVDTGSGLSAGGAGGLASPQARPASTATSTGVDAVVSYSAESIDSRKAEGVIYLLGRAQVQYKDVTIKAGRITIKWNENLLIAEGVPDTVLADSVTATDSLQSKLKDYPVFSDGNETMVGERMEYNFKSEKGRIVRGRTEFQKGYYFGDAVKRVDPTVFNVANGAYSTCDREDPHFHFRGKKMKVMVDDKVVAKPIVFYLGKIPLAIFPFAMFSAQEDGRQSGIILPQFGTSPVEGRYLRNLGYYWATNDYMDMRFTLDFFEKTGILFRSHVNYALRYKFSGSVSGSFTRKNFETRSERRWNLRMQHSQTIDANTNLSVNASFQSNNNFFREFSNNRDQRLNRQIVSNATLTRRWGEGRNNISVNLSQTRDIESGSKNTVLPQIRYTRNRGAIIPVREDKSGRTRPVPKWFNLIQYNYSGFLTNSVRSDTTDRPDDIDRRVQHDIALSYTNPNKLFGWLSWGQSFTYDEDWFDRRNEDFRFETDSTSTIISDENKGFFARRLFNYSTNASTNIYGTFSPNVFGITALRHRMSPSISFSYRPDFSAPRWGYYETLFNADSVAVRRDRFSGTPAGRSMSMNYSVNNLFQMKVGNGEKEKKIDLFNLNFSGGYNFAADSLRMSKLSSSFRASPRRNLSVSMNMRHSFYRFNRTLLREVDSFILPRLTSLRFDARWSLGGKQTTSSASQPRDSGLPAGPLGDVGARAGGDYASDFDPESAFSALSIPWRASLSFSYNITRSNPLNTFKSAYVDLRNVELQLTRNWRLGYRMRYDLERTEIVDQRLSFYRDLHCWEARFDWNVSGIGKGYYFIVNIKASHLRQVKVERRGGTSSVFSPF